MSLSKVESSSVSSGSGQSSSKAPTNSTTPAETQKGRDPRPLVVYFGSLDLSIVLETLSDIAKVGFAVVQYFSDFNEVLLNEAVGIFLTREVPLVRANLEKFKSLKLIVALGCSTAKIDLNAAASLGIAVSSIGAQTEEAADSTLSLILNLYRRTHWLADEVTAGLIKKSTDDFRDGRTFAPLRIRGDKLGIVGLGKIGTAVALRAKAFGFEVLFFDPYLPEFAGSELGLVRCESLKDLLGLADCVSLHCEYNKYNHRLISGEMIASMRHGVFFINTADSWLVDENALADALKSGKVGAAALDTHDNEGIPNIFSAIENVIVTPSSSYYSQSSDNVLRVRGCEEMRRGLLGVIPASLQYCINQANFNASSMVVGQEEEVQHVSTSALVSAESVKDFTGLSFTAIPKEDLAGLNYSALVDYFGSEVVRGLIGTTTTTNENEAVDGGGSSVAAAVRRDETDDGTDPSKEK